MDIFGNDTSSGSIDLGSITDPIVSTADITGDNIIATTSFKEGTCEGSLVSTCHGFNNYLVGGGKYTSESGSYDNVGIGRGVLTNIVGGNQNVGVGGLSLNALTTGYDTVALGFKAGESLTTGYNNALVGYASGNALTGGVNQGINNVAVGDSSLLGGTTCRDNTCVGKSAQSVGNNDYITAVGSNTYCSGDYGIALGYSVTAAANECILGDSNITSIANENDGTCDLGQSGKQFKNLYLSGSIVGYAPTLVFNYDANNAFNKPSNGPAAVSDPSTAGSTVDNNWFVLAFDDGSIEGRGFNLFIPPDYSTLTLSLMMRCKSAPASDGLIAQFGLYYREVPDDGAGGAWASQNMNAVSCDIANSNTTFIHSSHSLAFSSFSTAINANSWYTFYFARIGSDVGDTLVGDAEVAMWSVILS